MGSLKTVQATIRSIEPITSPRISFSADFLDDKNFISISPKAEKKEKRQTENNADFEFLSRSLLSNESMPTADELFLDGKLLPFWRMQNSEKLNKINLNINQQIGKKEAKVNNNKLEEAKISWFLDDDPSPRPPKCTLLWKELLRLKKKPNFTLSTSSSTSASSGSIADQSDEGKKGAVRRLKKGLENSRSASLLRIRPMVNVPICTEGKISSGLPPLLSLKKGRTTKM